MSGLDKQIIELPIDGGTDTKTDSKQLDAVKMALVQDGIFTTPKKIRKRYGYSSISTSIFGGGTLSGGAQIMVRGSELVAICNSKLYSYSSAVSAWIDKGYIPSAKYDALPSEGTGVTSCVSVDTAVIGNYRCNVSTFAGSLNDVEVIDTATGATIYGGGAVFPPSITRCQVYVVGTLFVFVGTGFADGTNKQIRMTKFDTASPSAGFVSLTTVTSDINTPGYTLSCPNNMYDVVVVGSNIFIGYFTATNFKILKLDTSFAILATYSVALTGITKALAVSLVYDSANSQITGLISYNSPGSAVYLCKVNLSCVQVTAPTSIISRSATQLTGLYSGSSLIVFAAAPDIIDSATLSGELAMATDPTCSYYIFSGTTLTSSSSGNFGNWLSIHSKIYQVNGLNYINLIYDTGTDVQLLTYTFTVSQPVWSGVLVIIPTLVGRAMYGTFGGSRLNAMLANVAVLGTTQAIFGVEKRVTAYGALLSGTNAFNTLTPSYFKVGSTLTITLGDQATQYSHLAPDSNLLIGAGLLYTYDGNRVFESNFLYPPEIQTATQAAGTGPAAGTYKYMAVYEFVDANGQVHQSLPSQPVTVTTDGTKTITLTVRGYNVQGGLNGSISSQNAYYYYVVIYRTAVNGSTFYRFNNTGNGLGTSTTIGAFSQATATVTDTYTDAAINLTANPVIYTSGNIMPNEEVDSVLAMEMHKGRAFLLTSDDPYSLLFSKTHVSGEPMNFNYANSISVEQSSGPLIAFKSMDDKLVLFKQDRPYVVFGEGPDDTGANSTYTTPQGITCPVGCDDPRGVVTVPDGILFRSKAGGIWKLDRGLNASYVGAEVEAYNSYDVTSAVRVPNSTQVRFTLSNGTALSYDYLVNKWSVHTNVSAVSATAWNSAYVFLKSNGSAYQESTTLFTDNGTAVSLLLQTGWISFGSLQGFKRCWKAILVGDYISSHTLTVKIGFDYEAAWSQTVTITPDTIVSVAPNNDVYQFEIGLQRQKIQAVRFQIFDTASGGSGEGFSLSKLNFLVGLKKGFVALPATKKFG